MKVSKSLIDRSFLWSFKQNQTSRIERLERFVLGVALMLCFGFEKDLTKTPGENKEVFIITMPCPKLEQINSVYCFPRDSHGFL
jgi:hypothetical protein